MSIGRVGDVFQDTPFLIAVATFTCKRLNFSNSKLYAICTASLVWGRTSLSADGKCNWQMLVRASPKPETNLTLSIRVHLECKIRPYDVLIYFTSGSWIGKHRTRPPDVGFLTGTYRYGRSRIPTPRSGYLASSFGVWEPFSNYDEIRKIGTISVCMLHAVGCNKWNGEVCWATQLKSRYKAEVWMC